MFVSKRLPTAYGSRLALPPSPLIIPTEASAAAAFALEADHAADEALAAGRFAQAERLSHTAYEARCRASAGARA